MTLLELFLTFLKVGAVSFGGGYGMISLLQEEIVGSGWLVEDEFINFIAVSESTPGPLAVNMATFIGSAKGGVPGAFVATLGVVIPSFIIILLIAAIMKNLLKYAGVSAFLGGIRPCVAGLISATAVTMILSVVFGISTLSGGVSFSWKAFAIFAAICTAGLIAKKIRGKSPSPILLIVLSAILGIVFYSIPK